MSTHKDTLQNKITLFIIKIKLKQYKQNLENELAEKLNFLHWESNPGPLIAFRASTLTIEL